MPHYQTFLMLHPVASFQLVNDSSRHPTAQTPRSSRPEAPGSSSRQVRVYRQGALRVPVSGLTKEPSCRWCRAKCWRVFRLFFVFAFTYFGDLISLRRLCNIYIYNYIYVCVCISISIFYIYMRSTLDLSFQNR